MKSFAVPAGMTVDQVQLVVMGAELPSVICEDEDPAVVADAPVMPVAVVLSTELPGKPEPVRKRRRGPAAES